jgi:flagellar basal-body rod protein FlgC
MFRTLDLSTTGLVAQRHRLDTIAGNIANLNTTRDEKGNSVPYQRRFVTFMVEQEKKLDEGRGVGVAFNVQVDQSAPRKVYQPGHPDADADGLVSYPAIEVTKEFVNAVEASRAYEANLAAIDITKGMYSETLKILQ